MKDFPFFLNSLTDNFKLYLSPYKLNFKNKAFSSRPVEGVLFAFDFGSDLIGYSDFLPWPFFKEKPLSYQLNKIKQKNYSTRFLIAKQNAFLDATARKKKIHLFFGLKIPPSHFLIEDLLSFKQEEQILEKGFKHIKVKLKPENQEAQVTKLKFFNSYFKYVKWRLDLQGENWDLWKHKLISLKKSIDFIEDPSQNNSLFKEKDLQLFAEDWFPCSFFKIKIVKPSRDFLLTVIQENSFFRWKRLIFTHNFDHPLGQVSSAFWASWFYKKYNSFFETGALNNQVFVPQESYPLEGAGQVHFLPPSGYGFGFSESLRKEKWKRWL